MKNWTKAIESDLKQVNKKLELCCVVSRKEMVAQNTPIEIQ